MTSLLFLLFLMLGAFSHEVMSYYARRLTSCIGNAVAEMVAWAAICLLFMAGCAVVGVEISKAADMSTKLAGGLYIGGFIVAGLLERLRERRRPSSNE